MSVAGNTVAAPAAYNTAADASLSFEPDFIVLRADSGNAFVSLDGVTDHFSVKATDTDQLILEMKGKKLWFKQNGGASTVRWAAFTRT